MDYAFVHDGRVYTPNRTLGLAVAHTDDRNAALEASELARWAHGPAVQVAYYDVAAGIVTAWRGVRLGTITSSHVVPHNFGGRLIILRMRGTNGGEYAGRASYDGGNVITLRRRRLTRARSGQ